MNNAPSNKESTSVLLIDGRRRTIGEFEPTTDLLGLSILRRLVEAGRKAGFARISVLADKEDKDAFRTALGDTAKDCVATRLPERSGDGPMAVVPANLLGQVDWLTELARHNPEEPKVRHGPAAISLFGPNAPFDSAEAGETLVFESPPLALNDKADLTAAADKLLQDLIKKTDGFMSRHVERKASLAISRRLAPTRVTPNQMTLLSVAVGIAAGPFFLSSTALWQTVGALLFLAHSILDGCDGELARLRFQESRLGGILDFWGDNVVHSVVFACMAIGWWSAAGGAWWPLALGAAALIGTFGSAGVVYWHAMRNKTGDGPLFTSVSSESEGRFSRLLDSLTRRDFIYLVLALALIGQANWFLALTAVGAPVFLVSLLVAAASERSARRASRSTA